MSVSRFRAITCAAVLVLASAATSRAQVPPPPTGLNAQVAGTFVTLFWNAAPGAVSYRLQVGTAPGASNLFDAQIGNLTVVSGSVGAGTYFWRVMAIGTSGSSAPSGESQFTIGIGCTPPGPPRSFSASVSGFRVTLQWLPPATGDPPTTYIIEAGSSPGLSNLFNSPNGSPATQLSVDAPPGQYFVRLRAQNACGTSDVSNEQLVSVGGLACSYSASPGTVNVIAAGGPITINVNAPGGCRWQLVPDSFITPMTTPSGSGSASISFNVGASGGPRTGQILLQAIDPGTVSTPRILVQQAFAACAVTLNPNAVTVPSAGRTDAFTVNAPANCAWSAASMAGFLSLVGASSGMGPGTLSYQVAQNTAAGSRAGAIRVTSTGGFQDFSVTQAGVTSAPTADFVMRQNNVDTTTCDVAVGNCTLDGSNSTPQADITSYTWRTTRYRVGGQDSSDEYTGRTTPLILPCSQKFPLNTDELFDVTLTVRNVNGQSNTRTRRLLLKNAGCGN
jgi:hypothetical protein